MGLNLVDAVHIGTDGCLDNVGGDAGTGVLLAVVVEFDHGFADSVLAIRNGVQAEAVQIHVLHAGQAVNGFEGCIQRTGADGHFLCVLTLVDQLENMGYNFSDEQMEDIFARFKILADKKKNIMISDLEALAHHRRHKDLGGWQLAKHVVNVGTGIPNTSYVKLVHEGEEVEEVAIGTGPLDASFKAINRLTRMKNVNLDSFSLNAVTDGEDAIGEAVVKIDYNGELYTGTGISTDVIEASIRAYVNGINKIKAEQKG